MMSSLHGGTVPHSQNDPAADVDRAGHHEKPERDKPTLAQHFPPPLRQDHTTIRCGWNQQRKNMYARSYSPPQATAPQANPVTHTAKFQKYSSQCWRGIRLLRAASQYPALTSMRRWLAPRIIGPGRAELPGDLRWLEASLEGSAHRVQLSRRQMNGSRLDPPLVPRLY